MHRGLISRASAHPSQRCQERGVTIVLVALAMVAIISMAALSIDVITLYLAREEAQRTADAAALAAARVLSVSGVTGNPDNTQGGLPFPPWQTACTLATQVAQAVVRQNTIGRAGASSPTVTFLYNGVATDCSAGGTFAINPQVKVDVVQPGLPTFFSRLWNRTQSQVSATGTAEAFNPSNSLNTAPNGLVTVTPRCVKPWLVPNRDPRNSVGPNPAPIVGLSDGSIQNAGIQLAPGTGTGAIIGEKFAIVSDCVTGNPNCRHGNGGGLIEPPTANGQGPGTLDYVPALIGGTANGVPSCATGSAYQEAIAGCDQSTLYVCGVVGGGAQADLTFNPGKTSGDTATATECRIHQGVGQDLLDSTQFPFQIHAGLGNPVLTSGVITSSNSIVTVPVYDDVASPFPIGQASVPVTIVGFLQVFINGIDTTTGNINVTVLNVAGCSNTATDSTPTVSGSSPVPIRLITAP
jgi:Flp pilus assembly protein TadG